MNEEIDQQGIKERVEFGKTKEDQIVKVLQNAGYRLKPGTFKEDCEDKTDCWYEMPDGTFKPCAVKVRTTKDDILACLWEPFHGVTNPFTKKGRDMVTEYHLYITMSKDGKEIRLAKGNVVHKIYNEIWEECLAAHGGDITVNTNRCLLNSVKHPGCQVWFHFDRKNNRPKILGFIPTNYLSDHKQITRIKYDQ